MTRHTSPGFFVLRAPLYPFDALVRGGDLRELMKRPELREALFLASPSLESELDEKLDGKRAAKVDFALLRYFARLTGRATPFGLFAGYCMGRTGETTQLQLDSRDKAQRHTRLDHVYITRIADDVLHHCEPVRRRLACFPGSSTYELAGKIRFAEGQATPAGVNYTLTAMTATDFLRATLERARQGTTAGQLAETLAEAAGAPLEAATSYVDQLQTSRVVDTSLTVPITGRDPLDYLIDELRKHDETRATAQMLEASREALAQLDRGGIGRSPNLYRKIANGLSVLPHAFDLSRLFQVDLQLGAHAMTLGKRVLDEVQRGAAVLAALQSPQPPRVVRDFVRDFTARFGDREVPLLEALDEEAGIPFGRSQHDPAFDPSPLLAGFPFPKQGFGRQWQVPHVVLLQKLVAATRDGASEIVLTDADVEALTLNRGTPLCDSVVAIAQLAAASNEAIDRGEYLVSLQMVVGPTAMRMLGRFAYADPALAAELDRLAKAEAACRPDAVIAEIVHVPEGRVGNIVARPLLREYEIPYLGRSGAPHDKQIPVEDLLVSVVDGQVRLRSKRLGRTVLPRNSTAFKYTSSSNVTVYSFLSAMQQPGFLEGISWSWGPLYDSPYLPRVRYGKCVLFRAQWYLDATELDALRADRSRVAAWREARRMPRFITIEEGDSALPIDLENPLAVDMFLDYAKGRRTRVLEMFPGPDELCVTGPDGRYVHELILPLVREPAPTQSRRAVEVAGERTLLPGSRWAFAKLYASPAACDALLCEHVAPLLATSDCWFFIRYADPEHHLRVRVRAENPTAIMRELEQLAAQAHTAQLIWRFQWDTYDRELERYGGEHAIDDVEQIFHADSQAAAAILETLHGHEAGDARWRITLLGIDRLLDDLRLDLVMKHALADAMAQSFASEFDAPKQAIDARFRTERASLEQLLARRPGEDHDFAPAVDAFASRSTLVAPIVDRLRALDAEGKLATSWRQLAQSLVHMHVNRMTRSNPRAHELLLYGYLARLYRSQIARTTPRSGRTSSS